MVISRKKRRELLVITEDLFGRSVDAVLSVLAYIVAIGAPQPQSGAPLRARIAADRFLNKVNYDVIKNAIITARKRRYIQRTRHAVPEITEAGRRRLREILPVYDEKRAWDGRLHLVTYDIPEEKKKTRDALRRHLRKIGCAKLQESVWITPYNPIDLLREFTKENGIAGTVIISDLGRDASVGEESIAGLVMRLYNLEGINNRYKEWLMMYEDATLSSMGYKGLVQYLAILKDDPQLPFVLLPRWWAGVEAFKAVKPLLEKLSLSARPRKK